MTVMLVKCHLYKLDGYISIFKVTRINIHIRSYVYFRCVCFAAGVSSHLTGLLLIIMKL